MMREFVGFGAYGRLVSSMKACRAGNLLLLVFSLICLTVRVFRAVQDGVLDICRIIHNDCSIQLLIPLSSIRSFGGYV